MNANALPESALWFVSNCHPVSLRYRVTSGRIEYAHDLYFSGAFNKSAYTRADECKRHKLLKQMLEEKIDGMEPINERYTYYLPSKTLSVKTI